MSKMCLLPSVSQSSGRDHIRPPNLSFGGPMLWLVSASCSCFVCSERELGGQFLASMVLLTTSHRLQMGVVTAYAPFTASLSGPCRIMAKASFQTIPQPSLGLRSLSAPHGRRAHIHRQHQWGLQGGRRKGVRWERKAWVLPKEKGGRDWLLNKGEHTILQA